MTLSLVLRRFEFPLAKAVGNARMRYAERRGLLLQLRNGEAELGVGEASPLPGYSDESLDDAEQALTALGQHRLSAMLSMAEHGRLEALARMTEELPPSARCGLEAALLEAASRARGITVSELLGGAPLSPLATAFLVDAEDARDARDLAEECAERHARALKLKIGRDLEGELARAAELRDALPDVELRFDANRSLRFPEHAGALMKLAALHPSLLEEPCATSSLDALATAGLPLALDESLRLLERSSLERMFALREVRALVLKPMTLGLLHAWSLMLLARASGVRAIVGHTYESLVGRRACTALASLDAAEVHGLEDSYLVAEGGEPASRPSAR